jgi:hypothetical protein
MNAHERNYDELAPRTNPVYRAVLIANPLAETPLFDSIPHPPRTIQRSRTQMESFDKLIPTIKKKQTEVLNVIKAHGPITTKRTASIMDWTINLVSGRIAELQHQGYVTECGSVIDPITNRSNSLWRAL